MSSFFRTPIWLLSACCSTRLASTITCAILLFGTTGVVDASYARAARVTAPTVATPDTVVGNTLKAWLDAFASEDRDVMAAYLARYEPNRQTDEAITFRDRLGPFKLISVTQSDTRHIEFLLSDRNGVTVRGKFDVDNEGRPVDSPFLLRAMPPGAIPEAVQLDGTLRNKVVAALSAQIEESYVYPELAKRMAQRIRSASTNNKYESVQDGDQFAKLLTDDLVEISHDKHLRVAFSPYQVQPQPDHEQWQPASVQQREHMERSNCGFRRLEILPDNVGYLKLDGFDDPGVCGATAIAAMGFLAHVDALVIDLRENGGGESTMVALLASYFFGAPTHLNDVIERKGEQTIQSWTLPFVPGERLTDKPVYILTSNYTFSAAEEFTYDLQSVKRATVVGETTGGGAHLVGVHQITPYFTAYVPYGRALNPVTNTDWEGVGVQPDIATSSSEALEKAVSLIRAKQVQVHENAVQSQ